MNALPLLAVVLGQTATFPFPTGRTETINILHWDSNQLPPIVERSEQLPLTDAELVELSSGGFAPRQIAKMVEERRCACDASAAGLVRLRRQGVAPEVLAAVSLHALRPNRAVQLLVSVDFASAARSAGGTAPAGLPRESFLYLFVDDGPLTRVFVADVGQMLGRRFAHETMLDRSDLLLHREVRRVELSSEVPLKTYGRHRLLVTTSARPTITHPSELDGAERARAQSYEIDYPRASLGRQCRLRAAFRQDPVLAHRWTLAGSRFECEWN